MNKVYDSAWCECQSTGYKTVKWWDRLMFWNRKPAFKNNRVYAIGEHSRGVQWAIGTCEGVDLR